MRKRIILILTVLLFSNLLIQAQSKNLFAEPKELALKNNEEDLDTETGRFNLLVERFYPIGWSKDGKFAFLVEPADEACGCYYAHLVIQDLRDDKILWERKYEGSSEKEETIKTYWKKSQKEFSRKLNEYGIVAGKKFVLRKSSFNYRKDTLTPELENNLERESDEVSGNLAVRISSKISGVKTIYAKTFKPEIYDSIIDAELSGSLVSPFEPRAVVILIETKRGWEGPPNVTQIRIIGAGLSSGFQK